MPIFLIFFSAMSFFTPSPSNEIIVQIEEFDFLEQEECAFGAHSFGLIYKGDLQWILLYCMAVTNQPVLEEAIQLEEMKYLEVRVGSRSKISSQKVAQAVLEALLNRFNLKINSSERKMNKVLKISRINQNPFTVLNIEKYKTRTNSGGISSTDDGNIEVFNSECYHLFHFLTKQEVLLCADKDYLANSNISLLFPQKLHKKLPKGIKQLKKIMEEHGIQCKIVKEPVRMIVPKE